MFRKKRNLTNWKTLPSRARRSETRRTGTRPVDVGCDVIAIDEEDCSPKTPSIPLDDVALL